MELSTSFVNNLCNAPVLHFKGLDSEGSQGYYLSLEI